MVEKIFKNSLNTCKAKPSYLKKIIASIVCVLFLITNSGIVYAQESLAPKQEKDPAHTQYAQAIPSLPMPQQTWAPAAMPSVQPNPATMPSPIPSSLDRSTPQKWTTSSIESHAQQKWGKAIPDYNTFQNTFKDAMGHRVSLAYDNLYGMYRAQGAPILIIVVYWPKIILFTALMTIPLEALPKH